MEHPFIANLSDLSLEDLQTKVSELTNKLNFAYKMGNGPLIHQLTMALESYRNAYSKKMSELMDQQKINAQIKIQK